MPNNEWGDFQTPAGLAEEIVAIFANRSWSRVLEPTCGVGAFLSACKLLGDVETVGVEIQEDYARRAAETGARVLCGDIFRLNLGRDIGWESSGPLLVVGNPPWVTNAQLGSIGSINLPTKSNLRGLKGLDAITGSANFDIAEFIVLKVALELADEHPTVALLCKTEVAKNVIDFFHDRGVTVSDPSIRRIDAKRWFGASVDACLFTFTVGGSLDPVVPVYAGLDATVPERRMGYVGGRLVADLDAHLRSAYADGVCPFEWRQGVKHDAARVMELREGTDGQVADQAGQPVSIEPDWVYPLLKCTDVHHGRIESGRLVVVSQRSLSDGTSALRVVAPLLWEYLLANAAVLDARKSRIYSGRDRFAMFGVGDYTFAPWKVAVSGLHPAANFRVVGPRNGRPVLFDDTCYFLPFADASYAAITAALLSTEDARDLIAALAHSGAKRPITKKLLQRIDLRALGAAADRAAVVAQATALVAVPITVGDFDRYMDGFDKTQSARDSVPTLF